MKFPLFYFIILFITSIKATQIPQYQCKHHTNCISQSCPCKKWYIGDDILTTEFLTTYLNNNKEQALEKLNTLLTQQGYYNNHNNMNLLKTHIVKESGHFGSILDNPQNIKKSIFIFKTPFARQILFEQLSKIQLYPSNHYMHIYIHDITKAIQSIMKEEAQQIIESIFNKQPNSINVKYNKTHDSTNILLSYNYYVGITFKNEKTKNIMTCLKVINGKLKIITIFPN